MCPIVPMFTCGFDRSNFSFAIVLYSVCSGHPLDALFVPLSGTACFQRPQGSMLPGQRASCRRAQAQRSFSTSRSTLSEGLKAQRVKISLGAAEDAFLRISGLAVASRGYRVGEQPKGWWTGEDSNLRSPQGAADLQSAAISRSATCPTPRNPLVLCRTHSPIPES